MERYGLFLSFLLVAAGQDLRSKQVEVRVYIVFGVLAAGLVWYQWYVRDLADWPGIICNLCIALGMLAACWLCPGAIGAGDGCFFLVSGMLLSFWENLALLFYGILLCGGYCLLKVVVNQLYQGTWVKHQTVPFLPFLVPVGIWLVIAAI